MRTQNYIIIHSLEEPTKKKINCERERKEIRKRRKTTAATHTEE